MRICKEGWPFVVGCCGLGALLLAGGWMTQSLLLNGLSGIAFLAAFYCAYFFRDPSRTIPAGDRWILAPADGKILEIIDEPGSTGPSRIIRIFLSIFEPHLQRSPVKGRIQSVRYRKGKFLDARDPQAAFENEQNRIEIAPISSALRTPVVVTQIAGLIARRIRCWVQEGQPVEAGQRIGLIQFGSQVDIQLPASARLRVKAGDHVKAGETILAEV